LQDELKVLFPGIRISDRQMRLNEEDVDLFITYAVSNILYYQKELKKLEVRGFHKLIDINNINWVCNFVTHNPFFSCDSHLKFSVL
jgi:hypothetical protein